MKKGFMRSKKNRTIAGVCGGLGEYFDVDPTVFRLVFVLIVFAGGAGILAYIIFWIVMPEADGSSYAEDISKTAREKEKIDENKTNLGKKAKEEANDLAKKYKGVDGRLVIGGILIILGLMFTAENLLPGWNFYRFWPLAVVVVGLALVINSMGRE